MKKRLEAVRNILSWTLTAAAAVMIIFTIVSLTAADREDRSILGFRAFIALSDSMSATDFDAGDLVLVKEVDPATLKEGDIIAYISRSSASNGETTTHKIRRLTADEDGEPGFITYGTTTDTDDEGIVTYGDVLGVYRGHIPKVGRFIAFIKTTGGFITCILVPLFLIVLSQGVSCIRLLRTYRAKRRIRCSRPADNSSIRP